MNTKIISLALVTAFSPALEPAMAQPANVPIVKQCQPPGGLWGVGNSLRAKILVFGNGTALYYQQAFATPDKSRWAISAPFASSGASFKGPVTQRIFTATPAGDGYDVSVAEASGYRSHFTCGAPTANAN